MSSLESAKVKLGNYIVYEDLPRDRIDPLWAEIRLECGLTVGELSALNAVCSPSGIVSLFD
jgi:hypothetical protein